MIVKLTSGPVLATMTSATSCRPDGTQASLTGLLIPHGMALESGDRVAILPTWALAQIQYLVLNKY